MSETFACPGGLPTEADSGETPRPNGPPHDAPGADPLRRWVHLALGIYLLPALALVLLIGGLLAAVELILRAAGGAVRVRHERRRAVPGTQAPTLPARPAAVRTRPGRDDVHAVAPARRGRASA